MPGIRRTIRIEDGVVVEDSVHQLTDAELRQSDAEVSDISRQVQESIENMRTEMDLRMAALHQNIDESMQQIRASIQPIEPIKPIKPIKPLKPLF